MPQSIHPSLTHLHIHLVRSYPLPARRIPAQTFAHGRVLGYPRDIGGGTGLSCMLIAPPSACADAGVALGAIICIGFAETLRAGGTAADTRFSAAVAIVTLVVVVAAAAVAVGLPLNWSKSLRMLGPAHPLLKRAFKPDDARRAFKVHSVVPSNPSTPISLAGPGSARRRRMNDALTGECSQYCHLSLYLEYLEYPARSLLLLGSPLAHNARLCGCLVGHGPRGGTS